MESGESAKTAARAKIAAPAKKSFRTFFARETDGLLPWYDRCMGSSLTYTRKTISPESTKQLAATLAQYLHEGDTIVLSGDLGAGKTQFVQGLAYALGIRDAIVSPTFNILLAYPGTPGGLPLYHFDLYRLDEPDQLEDIGFYETIDGDGISVIEWGEKFLDAMPYSYLEIVISCSQDENNSRKITVRSIGDRARQLLHVWATDSKSRLMKA
ncbi:tRNA (adenosine(37)-N6)-threonylcarbamoyltransferase complex ATPase subunit type 1 TsaE [Eggerthellaceae bacterium 3-80]